MTKKQTTTVKIPPLKKRPSRKPAPKKVAKRRPPARPTATPAESTPDEKIWYERLYRIFGW